MKKNEKLLIGLAAGVGAAALLYSLLPKRDIPKRATAVQPFDMDRYLGTWNEIARLPNRIEKDVKSLTETYSRMDDGFTKVVTRAYNAKSGKWSEFTGKIKFAGAADVGMLKVSYFGPVYLSYNILDLDDDYQYALVSGSGLDYLWILSRESTIPEHIKKRFLKLAKLIGFEVSKLEWDVV